ncbi:ABATE domain-containing protein [Mycobacterium sp.]|uniref:CGNR zinc finger domain-containing protein n=1 Tax=Mycobacterium sp. TaxID=1785 RepID=UPI0031CDC2D6
MGGEPSLAVDLADTLVTVTDPPTDLIADPDQYQRWWQLQACRLPVAGKQPVPELTATRRLRHAIREAFDAHLASTAPLPTSLDDINAVAAAAPTSTRLDLQGNVLRRSTRWHLEHGGHPSLAAIVNDAITVLTDNQLRSQLRRCANPACSMLFLATNPRRIWCTANICGNRTRAHRHYQQHHTPKPSPTKHE